MESLPIELLRMIVSLVPMGDLRAVRATCRSLQPEAEAIMFRHLSVWHQKDSFERLAHISKRDHLRHHVQSLHIGCERLSGPIYTKQEFLISLCYASRRRIPLATLARARPVWNFNNASRTLFPDKPDWDRAKLSSAWQRINHLIRDYRSWDNSYEDIQTLTEVFKNLPNLRTVKLPVYSPFEALEEGRASWGAIKVYKETLLYPFQLDANQGHTISSPGVRQLQSLLRASSNSKIRLDTLIIEAFRDYQHDTELLTSYDWQSAREGLQYVQQLELSLPLRPVPTLSNFVSLMPLLENLVLKEGCSPVVDYVQSLYLLPRFRHLKSLSLWVAKTPQKALLSFLVKHAETLKTVVLQDIVLENDTVEEFAVTLRRATRLTSLDIRGCICKEPTIRGGRIEIYIYSGDYISCALKDFILRDTDKFPSDILVEEQSDDGFTEASDPGFLLIDHL